VYAARLHSDEMTRSIQRIFGIDFSGAQNAGDHIWIAATRLNNDGLLVEKVMPATSLANGSPDRTQAIAAVRDFIANQNSALFGMDFPFSLHESQLGESNWSQFVASFSTRFPTAEHLYQEVGGKGRELRRQTDGTAKTPFAPGNLRIYRQTYYGLRDLLAPLTTSAQAVVCPMQHISTDMPILIEVCPAVTLARHQLRLPGYKGHEPSARAQRNIILQGLKTLKMFLTRDIAAKILNDAGGDALDSVIAAFAAATAFREGALDRQFSPVERLEGSVFA
jgi:hypothetical protein